MYICMYVCMYVNKNNSQCAFWFIFICYVYCTVLINVLNALVITNLRAIIAGTLVF